MALPKSSALLLIAIVAFAHRTADAQDISLIFGAKVGTLSDPANWQINGLKILKPDAVKRALSRDFDTLMATHRAALRSDLPSGLKGRALTLFQYAGFPDATVEVTIDETADGVVIDVSEGSRYMAGEIVVTGVDDSIAQAIVDTLCENDKDTDKGRLARKSKKPNGIKVDETATWRPGKPARCDDITPIGLRNAVDKVLRKRGYFESRYETKLKRDEHVIELHVDFKELGTGGVIQNIVVVGNERNSREEILRLLDLRCGEPLSAINVGAATEALLASGRFHKATIGLETGKYDSNMKIKVREIALVPALGEPLSRETKALMKCRDWLTHGEGRLRDMVTDYPRGKTRLEYVMSARGTILNWWEDDTNDSAAAYSFEVSDSEVVVYDFCTGKSLDLPAVGKQLNVNWVLGVTEDHAELPFSFNLGLGFRTAQAGEPAIDATIEFEPASYPVVSLRDVKRTEWNGHVLLLESKSLTIRVDESTGEILECLCHSVEEGSATVTWQGNYFEQAQRKLHARSAKLQPSFQSTAAATSLIQFVCESKLIEWLGIAYDLNVQQRKELVAELGIIAKLVDRDAFACLDDLWDEHFGKKSDEERLYIPWAKGNESSQQCIARAAVGFADDLFPRESWAWTTYREMGCLYGGHRAYASAQLQAVVESADCGPLGCWLEAELLVGHADKYCGYVAKEARNRLSTPQFHADCEVLLAKAMPHLTPVVQWLAELTPDERELLAKLLDVDESVIETIVAKVAGCSADETPEAMLAALDELWESKWRERLQTRLDEIVLQSIQTADAG